MIYDYDEVLQATDFSTSSGLPWQREPVLRLKLDPSFRRHLVYCHVEVHGPDPFTAKWALAGRIEFVNDQRLPLAELPASFTGNDTGAFSGGTFVGPDNDTGADTWAVRFQNVNDVLSRSAVLRPQRAFLQEQATELRLWLKREFGTFVPANYTGFRAFLGVQSYP